MATTACRGLKRPPPCRQFRVTHKVRPHGGEGMAQCGIFADVLYGWPVFGHHSEAVSEQKWSWHEIGDRPQSRKKTAAVLSVKRLGHLVRCTAGGFLLGAAYGGSLTSWRRWLLVLTARQAGFGLLSSLLVLAPQPPANHRNHSILLSYLYIYLSLSLSLSVCPF